MLQAITLTEQALRQHGSADQAAAVPSGATQNAPSTSAGADPGRKRKSRFDDSGRGASDLNSGALPQQVIDQIRYAKARSALEGRAPAGWALGYECLARGPAGTWELARVTGVTASGGFRVEFAASPGQVDEVHRSDAKPHDSKVCMLTEASVPASANAASTVRVVILLNTRRNCKHVTWLQLFWLLRAVRGTAATC
jgi:hypothetical protein